jgi:hypothetical protein
MMLLVLPAEPPGVLQMLQEVGVRVLEVQAGEGSFF